MKKSVLVAAGLGTAAYAGLTYTLFNEVLNRDAKIFKIVANKVSAKKIEDSGNSQAVHEWPEGAGYTEYTIVNSRGMTLYGRLYKADKPSKVYAFYAHGYRSSFGEGMDYAKYYHSRNINVFLVDHQAHGKSEGKYVGVGRFEYPDCLQWLDFMNGMFGEDIEIILHGVSMGAATVMLMTGSGRLPSNVKFTVADCGFTTAYDEFDSVLKHYHIPSLPILTGVNMWSKLIANFDFKDTNALEAVQRAEIPMLFVHGKTDDFVPFHMGEQLYAFSNAPYKDCLFVENAWHGQSFKTDREAYCRKIDGFIEKFIEQK